MIKNNSSAPVGIVFKHEGSNELNRVFGLLLHKLIQGGQQGGHQAVVQVLAHTQFLGENVLLGGIAGLASVVYSIVTAKRPTGHLKFKL